MWICYKLDNTACSLNELCVIYVYICCVKLGFICRLFGEAILINIFCFGFYIS